MDKNKSTSGKRTVKDLEAKADGAVKGGDMLQSAFSNTLKSIGEGITQLARKA
jgi:hypothetical protein